MLVDTESDVKVAWGVRATPTTLGVDEQLRLLDEFVGFKGAGHAPSSGPVTLDARDPAEAVKGR